jgi:hypothetical protein
MDFHDLIYDDELGNKSFVRRRPTVVDDPTSEGGVATTYVDTPLIGAIAPAKTNDAAWLPEGVRINDVDWFVCEEELRAGDGIATIPDLILYNGVTYQALKAKDMSPWNVYMVLAQRVAV